MKKSFRSISVRDEMRFFMTNKWKKLVLLGGIALLATGMCACGKDKEGDGTPVTPSNEVVRCTVNSYYTGTDGVKNLKRSDKFEQTIDGAGNVIEEVAFDKSGNKMTVTSYSYDDAGNMISEIYNSLQSETADSVYIEYFYNTSNTLTKKVTTRSADGAADIVETELYTYDSTGNLVLTEIYEGENLISSYENTATAEENREYEYDANGNCVKEVVKAADGSVNMTIERTFNSDNRIELEKTVYADGSVVEKEYIYEKISA